MRRLLRLAELLFGKEIASRVIEPLLADWQREWADAQGHSLPRRVRVAIGGLAGFVATALHCAAVVLVSRPPAAAAFASAIAATAAVGVTVLVLATMMLLGQFPPQLPLDMLLIMMLPQAVSIGLAPAMLPAVLMLRRDRRVSWRHGAQTIALGFVLALVLSAWVVPRTSSGYFFTESQNERIYQYTVQNDRAGRPSYPGTASRDARPSTATERAERYARFRAQAEQRIALRPRPTASMLNFFRSYQFVWLTLAFGLMGWALGALRRPTVAGAIGWWALTWMVLFVPTIAGRFAPNAVRLPYWLPTMLFGMAAVGLLRAAARRGDEQEVERLEKNFS